MQNLIILTLATWRISSLLVNEDGPFDWFNRFRYWVGVRYNDRDVPYGLNVFGDLFSCVFCFSVWIGAILAIAYYFQPNLTYWVCLPFALSAGAIVVNKWTQ
jgi:hypothetical protein